MKFFDWIAILLVVVGGLNWGLVGLFEINLITQFLGEMTTLTRIVYLAIGLSAIYVFFMAMRMGKK